MIRRHWLTYIETRLIFTDEYYVALCFYQLPRSIRFMALWALHSNEWNSLHEYNKPFLAQARLVIPWHPLTIMDINDADS